MRRILREKLIRLAKYSDGLFTSALVAGNKNERDAFFRMKEDSPQFFEIIRTHPTIYRISSFFRVEFLSMSQQETANLSENDLYRSIVWSAFLMEHGNCDIRMPNANFSFNGSMYLLDPFDTCDFPRSITVITSPARLSILVDQQLSIFIPKVLFSRSMKPIFLPKIKTKSLPSDTFFECVIIDNLLEGSFIPTTESSCHQDARIYPGFQSPLRGDIKFKFDKALLNELKTKGISAMKDGYKFGVYPS